MLEYLILNDGHRYLDNGNKSEESLYKINATDSRANQTQYQFINVNAN